ncbi:unnamed protein product [Linum trigynum]|uniref:Transmembrane protein n=1 Tax=Linum trigynum TaxID=586398 RepID=A0AAV2CUW3_9ROSI
MAAVESFEDWESVHFPEKNPSSSSSAVAPNESETIADVQLNGTVATSSVSPPSAGVICPPPPINHEIVQINQPSSLTLSLPPPENESGDEGGGSEIGDADSGERRSRDRFEILKSGIYRVVRWCAVGRGSSGLWSCVVVAAAILMYARLMKWRRWVRDETANRFSLLIREKDEKIKQLMLQIARLNEMLVQRRRVVVVRVPHYYSL